MYSTPTLATRFARNTRVMRGDQPLSEDQMRAAAPSIFAEGKHASRSERYTYIPTIDVLRGLRKEGFEPFMVAQGQSRVEGKAEFTKHMIRMRHAGQVQTRPEANEIILINSHDGASCYQLVCGTFRFVCHNGMVVGDVVEEHVQVVNPQERHYVAVVVPLAAGMEPLNPALETAPPEAKPVLVLTNSARAFFESRQARTFSSSVNRAHSMMTLQIARPSRQASVTAAMSR